MSFVHETQGQRVTRDKHSVGAEGRCGHEAWPRGNRAAEDRALGSLGPSAPLGSGVTWSEVLVMTIPRHQRIGFPLGQGTP